MHQQVVARSATVHPQFFGILDIAKRKPVRHLMVNTNGIRIAKAIDLLVNTELPVSLIGSEVGFNTEAYFSTSFTAYTELSPSTYRNRFGKRK